MYQEEGTAMQRPGGSKGVGGLPVTCLPVQSVCVQGRVCDKRPRW